MKEGEFALDLARRAGAILMEGWRDLEGLDVDFKGQRDPVTEIDRASERFLRKAIGERYPLDRVLGEEEGEGGRAEGERLWIVDPLDGTVNYMHGHPVFAVSIALHVGGRVEVGVVHAPHLDETFHAVAGEGAFRNGKRIHVSPTADLSASLLATGFAYNRSDTAQNNLDNFSRLSLSALGLRRMGAASLDLAWVACGIFDGFWEIYLAPWDVAAGALLVREAGGRVTAFDRGEGWLFGRNIVASNGRIHDDMIRHLNPFP
ncbi:MAG: inositol monophosphatase family protein [Planctomycetota bacterium]